MRRSPTVLALVVQDATTGNVKHIFSLGSFGLLFARLKEVGFEFSKTMESIVRTELNSTTAKWDNSVFVQDAKRKDELLDRIDIKMGKLERSIYDKSKEKGK